MILRRGTHVKKVSAFVALASVCILAMQMLFAGVALASGPGSGSASGFDLTCARQGDASPLGSPIGPKSHQHAACCILHSSVLFAPSARGVASSVERLSDETSVPSPQYRLGALRSASELGPLSPRAPPFSSI
ncbi:MAG TPA: hypothetical protein VIE47_08955 [Methylocystis sp.]